MKERIRIGCGAGFSGDRIEPALVLIEKGSIDFLVLECLAERTIALAQKRKLQDPATGYDPLLERRIELLIEPLKKNKVRLITNMGAANPLMAMEKILEIAQRKNISIKVAAVTGDDVLESINPDSNSLETGEPIRKAGIIVSANAYLGAEGILEALNSDADIIITGRVADPSLFLAPMMYSFQWPTDNYDLLGRATVLGHLMECAGQVTGGYYADPGKKNVRDMANLGHPIIEISSDGSGIISKVDGTGGVVNPATAKEQLLYEVLNPFAYYTPDVIADFTSVFLKTAGENKVLVTGGGGKQKPETLKVSIGYQAGYLGEGEITYAGSNAVERAKLAGEIVKERLSDRFDELRVDLIGLNSVHGSAFHRTHPYEVRLRIAAKSTDYSMAAQVGEEVEALYTNGPGGGGGVRKYVHDMIGIVSTLIDRNKVKPRVTVKSI